MFELKLLDFGGSTHLVVQSSLGGKVPKLVVIPQDWNYMISVQNPLFGISRSLLFGSGTLPWSIGVLFWGIRIRILTGFLHTPY